MSSDVAWLELYDHQTCRRFYFNQETGDWSKDKPIQVPIVKVDPESVWSIWNEETRTTLYYHPKTRQFMHNYPTLYPVVSLSLFAKKSSLLRYLSLPDISQLQENQSTPSLDGQDQDLKTSCKAKNTIIQHPTSSKIKKQDSLLQSWKKRLAVSLPALSISQHQNSCDPGLTNAIGTSVAHLQRPCTSPKIQAPRIPMVVPLSPPQSPSSASSSTPSSSSFSHVLPISTLPSPITPLSPFSPSTNNNNKYSSNGKKYIFEHYVAQHFTTHKQGFLRRTPIPLSDLATWTKNSINKPLLRSTNKKYTKDAITCFKNIQKIMNDRSRKYHGRICACDDVTYIQSILLCGITKGQQIRDEIYVQLCKQLNQNPTLSSSQKGWELFSVLCSTMPPSTDLALYLKQFIHDHLIITTTTTRNSSPSHYDDGSDDDNNKSNSGCPSMFESYLCLKVDRICQQGPRGKVPSRAEIQLARMAVPQQQVEKNRENNQNNNNDNYKTGVTSCPMFGTPLTVIMKHQHQLQQQQQQQQLQQGPTNTIDTEKCLKIPYIVPFLVNAIRQLQGHATLGVFRLSGLADLVTSLRIQIEDGCDMHTLDLDICCGDPNVPASLLRLWLRELPTSLIPMEYYDQCIDQASDLDSVMKIVDCLPDVNRRILLYIIGFIQEFLTPEVCQLTLMTVNNLAMVFAPNFLHGPLTDDLELAVQKSKYEQLFIKTLLLGPKVNMDWQLYG